MVGFAPFRDYNEFALPRIGARQEVNTVRVKLVKLREAAGFSQQAFSEQVKISRSHYSQIETGEKDPSLKVGLRIKRALKYQNDDIFLTRNAPFSVITGARLGPNSVFSVSSLLSCHFHDNAKGGPNTCLKWQRKPPVLSKFKRQ